MEPIFWSDQHTARHQRPRAKNKMQPQRAARDGSDGASKVRARATKKGGEQQPTVRTAGNLSPGKPAAYSRLGKSPCTRAKKLACGSAKLRGSGGSAGSSPACGTRQDYLHGRLLKEGEYMD